MSQWPLMDLDDDIQNAVGFLMNAKRLIEGMIDAGGEVFSELAKDPALDAVYGVLDTAEAELRRVWPGYYEGALQMEQEDYDEQEARADANSY
jgi:hypothetical protein